SDCRLKRARFRLPARCVGCRSPYNARSLARLPGRTLICEGGTRRTHPRVHLEQGEGHRMTDDRGVLRGIAWREIFPWLMILRTFRTAVAPSVLLAAAAGTLVTPLARYVGAYVFLNADDREAMRTFASIDGYP